MRREVPLARPQPQIAPGQEFGGALVQPAAEEAVPLTAEQQRRRGHRPEPVPDVGGVLGLQRREHVGVRGPEHRGTERQAEQPERQPGGDPRPQRGEQCCRPEPHVSGTERLRGRPLRGAPQRTQPVRGRDDHDAPHPVRGAGGKVQRHRAPGGEPEDVHGAVEVRVHHRRVVVGDVPHRGRGGQVRPPVHPPHLSSCRIGTHGAQGEPPVEPGGVAVSRTDPGQEQQRPARTRAQPGQSGFPGPFGGVGDGRRRGGRHGSTVGGAGGGTEETFAPHTGSTRGPTRGWSNTAARPPRA